jgi:hypothetical protein
LIIDKGRRWPLCIDPQGQANKFLKKLAEHDSANGVDVAKLTDGINFTRTLENAIRFGKWVILENIFEVLIASADFTVRYQFLVDLGVLMFAMITKRCCCLGVPNQRMFCQSLRVP